MGRGQVSLFIILGVIAVIATVVFFSIQSSVSDTELGIEVGGEAEYAGQQELREFLDTCISDAAYHGTEIIRLQAGHIDIPAFVSSTNYKDPEGKQIVVQNGLKRVVIDMLGEGNEVAYWLDSSNRLAVPSEEYIELELSEYMEQSMNLCVNSFASFTEQNYVVDAGVLDVDVDLSNEILFTITYPITMSRGDVTFTEESFIYRLPVNLKKMVDIATELTLTEYFDQYLERDLLYFISLYSSATGSGEGFPPLTGATGSQSATMPSWSLNEVSDDLRVLFEENMPYVSIFGYGSNAPANVPPEQQGVYERLTHDIVNDFGAAEVDFFTYAPSEFSADIQPRDGDLIEPDSSFAANIPFTGPFAVGRFRFKYSLQFPIYATIQDGSPALDTSAKVLTEQPFIFNLPLGVFLCGNQHRQCTGRSPDGGITIDTSQLDYVQPESLFCDVMSSQPMRITAKDGYTGATIPSANLLYSCGGLSNTCFVGTTDDTGVLSTKMPICVNGRLRIEKPGYSQTKALLTTAAGSQERALEYSIYPLKMLDVDVQAVRVPYYLSRYHMTNNFQEDSCLDGDSFADTLVDGAEFDSIMITSNKGPSSVLHAFPDTQKLGLGPGKYSFSFLGIKEVLVQCREVEEERVCLEGNSASRERWPFLTYNNFEVDFTPEELASASKITFYVPMDHNSFDVNIVNSDQRILSDGAFRMRPFLDHDCDVDTIPRRIDIRLTEKEVEDVLRPRLE